ncbi:MAG: DUF4097 family beta strand repeat protein [Candidatus Latescibacteria bacterium]|nr:DUF4097 family beta strand repeat protein [Candidatus Latescibacterota bacterium]NIO54987.1 DUF4097 family beta strand repeat protein [Candidatus Latescibacterota bacterium]
MTVVMRMHKTKIALHLSFFVLTLAVAVNSLAGTLREEVKKTFPLSGETQLHIKNSRGKTIIIGKEGLKQISIEATKIVKTKSEEAAEELMKALTFEVKSEGDVVWIITHHPDEQKEEKTIWSFFKGLRHRTAVDFMVQVPRSFSAQVTTTSGDVEVASIDGNAKLVGTSGDVRIGEIGGSAYLEFTSGDVEIKEVKGKVKVALSSGSAYVDKVGKDLLLAATSGNVKAFNIGGNADVQLVSGDLIMKGCKGSLKSVSASGDMVIKDVDGSIEVNSSSGDIEIFLMPLGENKYNLNTCSGDVDVIYRLGRNLGFLLDVNTMSGSIEGDMDIKLEKVSRRHLKGIVGNGKATIVIATASGDVSIYKGNGD